MHLLHHGRLFVLRARTRRRTKPEVDHGGERRPEYADSDIDDIDSIRIFRLQTVFDQVTKYYKEPDRNDDRHDRRTIGDRTPRGHQAEKCAARAGSVLDARLQRRQLVLPLSIKFGILGLRGIESDFRQFLLQGNGYGHIAFELLFRGNRIVRSGDLSDSLRNGRSDRAHLVARNQPYDLRYKRRRQTYQW